VPEANEAAKAAAKDAAWWWVRTHPLQAARLASVAARHPQRTRQAVSEAQTLREAAPDPRVRRLRAQLTGPARQAGRDQLAIHCSGRSWRRSPWRRPPPTPRRATGAPDVPAAGEPCWPSRP